MAKLTTEQWAHVQATWESDPREGFQWLADELGLDVSRPVLSLRAANNGWVKVRSVALGESKKDTQKRDAPAPKNKIFAHGETSNNATSNEVKRTVGRPTAYQSSYAEIAKKLCLAFGATDAQLAEWVGVCEKTVNTWKSTHPEFLQSIRQGKAFADANVARSLYERAIGYNHPDVHICIWQGKAIITPITKHYAPDVGAGKYWLNNRQPSCWSNQVGVEVSQTSTKVAVEQLDQIYEAGMQKVKQQKEEIQARKLFLAQADSITKYPHL